MFGYTRQDRGVRHRTRLIWVDLGRDETLNLIGLEPNKTRGNSYGEVRIARVSTTDQDLSIQLDALKAAGCEIIRAEKQSGTTTEKRSELANLLEFLRSGDELVVTRIDRLARSVGDLQTIVAQLRAKGVALKATEQPIDTGSAAGKAFLDMLGVFAEFETSLRRERQMEGIAKAKAKGVYKGRKLPSMRAKCASSARQGKARRRSPGNSTSAARASIVLWTQLSSVRGEKCKTARKLGPPLPIAFSCQSVISL